jgi:D-alanyl-D-alanine carboxypeptidase
MTGTTYVNASGLPAEEQITTARDQVALGRAIQHRFPDYYQYFATPSFTYKGTEMHNHNNLLRQVRGVDGIKTGFTVASGYNLVSSVRRDEKHIVAVVLGGTSNAARDARMRQLIDDHIFLASTQRTVPIIVERNGQRIADGGWALPRRSSRMPAGATSRPRVSLASTAISVGRAPTQRSIWSAASATKTFPSGPGAAAPACRSEALCKWGYSPARPLLYRLAKKPEGVPSLSHSSADSTGARADY